MDYGGNGSISAKPEGFVFLKAPTSAYGRFVEAISKTLRGITLVRSSLRLGAFACPVFRDPTKRDPPRDIL